MPQDQPQAPRPDPNTEIAVLTSDLSEARFVIAELTTTIEIISMITDDETRDYLPQIHDLAIGALRRIPTNF